MGGASDNFRPPDVVVGLDSFDAVAVDMSRGVGRHAEVSLFGVWYGPLICAPLSWSVFWVAR